jgi:hypothetical protein
MTGESPSRANDGPACLRLTGIFHTTATRYSSIHVVRVSTVRYRELRRRCDRHVRRLISNGDLPDPFTLTEFLQRLAARRGRPIEVRPSEYVSGGACGMLLRLPDVDIIVHARTAPLHEEHIVLHEVGHMLCEHNGQSGLLTSELMSLLMPDLDPALVHRMLNRRSYTEAEEQEAELLATVILERVADRRPAPEPVVDSALASQMDRLKSTFNP